MNKQLRENKVSKTSEKWQRCLRFCDKICTQFTPKRIQLSSKLILWFGDSQVKYVKALTHFIQEHPPPNLKNNKRQARKGVNKKDYNKRNTRYMTNSKNS